MSQAGRHRSQIQLLGNLDLEDQFRTCWGCIVSSKPLYITQWLHKLSGYLDKIPISLSQTKTFNNILSISFLLCVYVEMWVRVHKGLAQVEVRIGY